MDGRYKRVGQFSKSKLNPNGRGYLLIQMFQSQKDASKNTGVPQSNISACCYGKIKTAGGYRWCFV